MSFGRLTVTRPEFADSVPSKKAWQPRHWWLERVLSPKSRSSRNEWPDTIGAGQIIKEGVVLYDLKGSTPFITPRPQTAEEALATAQKHFDFWMPLAQHSLKLSRDSINDQVLRVAAFLLHQAVERAYTCILLVETNYSPSTHSIKFLRALVEQIAPDLIAVWPRETKNDRRLFELLKRAYVDARYLEHYAITAEELAWLGERAEILRALVEARSCEKIVQLRAGALIGK